jgi:hypothetical protein
VPCPHRGGGIGVPDLDRRIMLPAGGPGTHRQQCQGPDADRHHTQPPQVTQRSSGAGNGLPPSAPDREPAQRLGVQRARFIKCDAVPHPPHGGPQGERCSVFGLARAAVDDLDQPVPTTDADDVAALIGRDVAEPNQPPQPES